jgi:hypothetical protein
MLLGALQTYVGEKNIQRRDSPESLSSDVSARIEDMAVLDKEKIGLSRRSHGR